MTAPPHSPGLLAQVACILEATARKPGNVHRFADFEDATYLDFLLSAAAIAPAMDSARSIGVGAAILGAVEATRRVVATNTNLGMILLLAPLSAALAPGEELGRGVRGVRGVLDGLTLDDARLAYRAIRLATPGGLGSSGEQDVADEPTVTLLDAMRLAADRDAIARQYANGFAEVFDVALPRLREALADGLRLEAAIVRMHVGVLADFPDTLIARKRGRAVAEEASRMASGALRSGSTGDLDAYLRADGHARNPGATADLVAAGLFAALADGTIALPRPSGPAGW